MTTGKLSKKGPEGPREIVPHPLGSITSPHSRKEVLVKEAPYGGNQV
jgi:hypothetical protein